MKLRTIHQKLISIIFVLVCFGVITGILTICSERALHTILKEVSDGMEKIQSVIGMLSSESKHFSNAGIISKEIDQAAENINTGMVRIHKAKQISRKYLAAIVICLVIFFIFAVFSVVLIHQTIIRPVYRMIRILDGACSKVTAASIQLSFVSQGTSDETINQVKSLDESVIALKKMAETAARDSDHADRADRYMDEGEKAVTSAHELMTNLIGYMNKISGAADQMNKIIKTIDEIAFQTQILAINAAIEAARAGQSGAGFGVVAGEVKRLAGRSAKAAGDTSDILEKTICDIRNIEELIHQTERAFSHARTGFREVSCLVKGIAQDSGNQSKEIENTYHAVEHMHRATEQSAANAKLSSRASVNMLAQAEQMNDVVKDLSLFISGHGEILSNASKEDTDVIRSLEIRNYANGDYLIRQGEFAAEAFIIESGSFKIFVDQHPNHVVATLKAGNIVGEVALMMDVKRTANVVAVEPSRAIVLPKSEFAKIFKDQTDLSRSVLYMIQKRLEKL